MNLKQLRKKVRESEKIENKDIKKILSWFKKKAKEDKSRVKKVSINHLKDWKVFPNGNIFHKSKLHPYYTLLFLEVLLQKSLFGC